MDALCPAPFQEPGVSDDVSPQIREHNSKVAYAGECRWMLMQLECLPMHLLGLLVLAQIREFIYNMRRRMTQQRICRNKFYPAIAEGHLMTNRQWRPKQPHDALALQITSSAAMFTIDKRFLHFPALTWAVLWRYTLGPCVFIWNFAFRILIREPAIPSRDAEAQKQHHQHEQQFKTACTERPRELTYVPIPGEWRRKEKPNWPESAFQVPAEVPDGTIYYVTKGRWIDQGSTAHIELLPSGHIVKYPKSNPYCQTNEEENRDRVRLEAEVYKRLNNSSYIPKLIDWDPNLCCLTLEHLENGNLQAYVGKLVEVTTGDQVINHVPIEVRRRWAVQATRAITVVHSAQVIHCDITPRNFLLNAQLDLRISDFAGCSISGSPPLIAPGSRYQPPGWNWKRKAVEEDDVFALGSVLYFIMVGREPYPDLEEEEVHELFQGAKFPHVDQLPCGEIIHSCWDGTFSSAERVVDALNGLGWEANIEQQW
ncbi:protein kinase-like domain [Pochonia chlamydosporia 170]|uniref:EKC/KEOPS complex subunit BUD32 n=1 Tax=Pochonia chlamydosporia 170 TaxID=1380566 RepID=A0A179F329_METCM|nr:protein kinase-like domain [Pochonia chlamydosporia 170]OAQ59760.1 protein kinase-like domain [Pochonia chlamydosporia 170]